MNEPLPAYGVILLLFIFAGSMFFACASYNECARVHPSWYCIAH